MTMDSEVTLLSDDEVVALGNALLARVEQETSDGEDTLDTRVVRPLVTVARSAIAAHETACMALLEPGPITWRGVAAYRDAVVERMLEPLRRTMELTRPADRIRTSLRDLRRSLREASSVHPAVLTACDPPEFYDTAPEDPPRVRWLKRRVRLRRRVGALADAAGRLLGRSPEGECRRDVDIRSLWYAHVDDRLGPRHYLRHEELQLLWARPWAHLLHAATTVMEAVLLLDQSHDALGLHLPTGTPGAEEDREIPDEESAELREAITQFHQTLRGLATAVPTPIPSTADAEEIFRRSLVLAGTPLLPRAWRPGDRAPVWADRLEARGREWGQWATRGEMELRALVTRVRFRHEITVLEDQLLTRLHGQTMQPLADRVDRLGSELRKVRDRLSQPSASVGEALEQALARASADVEVAEGLIDLAGVGRAEQVLDHLGSREARRIEGLITQLPDEVVPATLAGSREVDPAVLPVPWSPRDAAHEAFQPALPVVLGDAVPRFRDRVIKAWAMVHQVPHIVEYALDAARDALRVATPDDSPDARGGETPGGRAHTVACDGLTRATDTMTRAVEGLQPAWQELAQTVWEALDEDWTDFQRRVHRATADQRSWHGLGAAAALAIRRRWYLGRHAARHAWEDLQPRMVAVVTRVRQLLSQGQAAVGVARPTESQWLSTVDSLDEVAARRAAFPVVYRRLFGDGPLERRQLLAGRDAPLELVRDYIARWGRGHPAGSLLIEALPGGGRTSFLSVLAEEIKDVPVRWMTLAERMTSEEALAGAIGAVLGHPAASTLAELESVLLSDDPRSGGVVIVDDLEYLLLHVPDGARLMEAFLGFCTRSDSRVYWILSINGVAGPVVRAELPEAVRAFHHVRLDPLAREDLDLALLTRHEWSGLALQVLSPDSPGFLLRQRLARVRTAEARDRLLRSLYIDRLARATGGDIGQALLYWLRSATFEEGGEEGQQGDRVTLRPIERLDYRFLDFLPLVSTMTLRALLMHKSLTPTEHAVIFRLSEERARQTLEHLMALRLVEPHVPEGATDAVRTEARVRVVPGVAYGIRPAMRHAVLERLRATNLLPWGTR